MKGIVLVVLAALAAIVPTACGRAAGGAGNDTSAIAEALPPGHVPITADPSGSVTTRHGRAMLDSGNASFRANKHAEALAFYRRAAAEMPAHAAPWFGAYMVARALNDTVLADSAMRMVRTRAPGMQEHPTGARGAMTPASPHGATIPKAGGTF